MSEAQLHDPAARAADFGAVGECLLALLHQGNFPFRSFADLPQTQQFLTVRLLEQRAARKGLEEDRGQVPSNILDDSDLVGLPPSRQIEVRRARLDPLYSCAVALLGCRYPVQTASADLAGLTRRLVDAYLATLGTHEYDAGRHKFSLSRLEKNPHSVAHHFPIKPVPQASLKANIHLDGLLASLARTGDLKYLTGLLSILADKVYDDQIVSALLYAVGVREHYPRSFVHIVASIFLAPSDAKGLSTAIKALGLNGCYAGAVLAENNVLAGRGVGGVDLAEESAKRCDREWVEASVIDVDQDRLASCIRALLDEELGAAPIEFPSYREFWQRRWAWCVNGAHTRIVDQKTAVDTRATFEGHKLFRRMFSEAVLQEPLSDWDGTVSAGASSKLEHGKTRSIFSCDTLSYFAFEHLLGPVSRAWRNRRILLDPGKLGNYGTAEKVRKLRGSAGVNVMLDYDDFNSQHSTASMKTVFSVLCEHIGYPPHLASRLIDSFDKVTMRNLDGSPRVLGTLMSGHRATTVVNSILNAAYIALSVGPSYFRSMRSLHVGDDVYIATSSFEEAGDLLDKCRETGCRMNPIKQSLGTSTAEFLRCAIRDNESFGYLARSVASIVSGNWVTERAVSPSEALVNMVSSTRALINRSNYEGYADILSGPVAIVTRVKRGSVLELLSGRAALGSGPVYNETGGFKRWSMVGEEEFKEGRAEKVPDHWPSGATRDYQTHAMSDVERAAVQLLAKSPTGLMLDSSYGKALSRPDVDTLRAVKLAPGATIYVHGLASADEALRCQASEGVLSKYPVLTLLKNQLTNSQLRPLVGLCGGSSVAADIRKEAWGERARPVAVYGHLAFSDAARLGYLTDAGGVKVLRPAHF